MTEPKSGSRTFDAATGADIQAVALSASKGFGRGYDVHEVDSFVSHCAAVVDELRSQVQRCESEIAQLQQRIDRDSRSNEVERAISVLTTAQVTADRTVEQADAYSARVMSSARELYEDARRNAATLEQETQDKAQYVYEDAVNRAAATERETEDRVAELTQSAVTAQEELDTQTAYLRTLRDATRTQMETFLEGLLDHLADEYGRAHPFAAQAANEANGRRVRRTNRLTMKSGSGRAAGSSVRQAGLAGARRTSSALTDQPSSIPTPRSAPADELDQVDG